MGFWESHGWFGGFFFLLFLLFLPRLTVLFSVTLSAIVTTWVTGFIGLDGSLGGAVIFVVTFIGWISWVFYPRHLIAVIATMLHWSTNPFLTLGIWVIAHITLRMRKAFIKGLKEAWREERKKREQKIEGYTEENWWDVLGIGRDASITVIKSAYRKQAKRWHPDVNEGEGDPDKFDKATKAYHKALKSK